MGIKVLGTGSYLPAKVVTNDDIAKSLDTNDEWIFSHTGIRRRHIAAENETTSTMAAIASRKALEMAGIAAEEIDLIILATTSPDYHATPSTACVVQHLLGAKNAGAFDISAACSGFVYALEQARGYMMLHPEAKVLVIGAECLSRIVDWGDRSSCILFGDGAGAMVIGPDGKNEPSTAYAVLHADGSGAEMITRPGGTMKPLPLNPETSLPMPGAVNANAVLTLAGHEVFKFAVKALSGVANELCAHYNKPTESLDRVFAHQANARIIEAVSRRMKLPLEKFWLNLEETANTSGASVPIALDQALRAGELKDGMNIVMIGFGAGLTYAGLHCTWPCL